VLIVPDEELGSPVADLDRDLAAGSARERKAEPNRLREQQDGDPAEDCAALSECSQGLGAPRTIVLVVGPATALSAPFGAGVALYPFVPTSITPDRMIPSDREML
jgi:hypothetical protein